jgi:hypothetical protein
MTEITWSAKKKKKGSTRVNIKAMWERARRTGQREVEPALERDTGVVLHVTALAGHDEWGAGVLNTHAAGLGFVALVAPLKTKKRVSFRDCSRRVNTYRGPGYDD